MKDVLNKVIDNLKCCKTYCSGILNRPSGVYSIETTVVAGVIQDYVKECLELLKDE